MPTPQEMLDRLDTRHDELIQKLDDLNAQIEAALVQFAKARGEGEPAVEAAGKVKSADRRMSRAA